ncbi:MAG: glycine C-acetyltransferase [Spirochaetia bacterium]|jgi:glycine C-acetyltransferase|uniref:2-amino-3-ketobutyrate coenzyme A ligase n=1 Tax=uncultured spirochete TaxID=156406 RepID=A0A3P3XGY7_9SPIR|nr:glycine C-acetyltransferase [Rectinema subterraneum]MDQ7795983.1 glycine C-acetyltransferase [Spirochaetia bacterium]SLM10753.1 glycine C-acetyltransferase [uncultured spirochete]
MYGTFKDELAKKLEAIKAEGLYKDERVIITPQGAAIRVADGKEVLNFCANNYLGLSNDPRIRAAAVEAMERFGYGLSSVRFICGTQSQHKDLERKIADFLGMEDAILFSSCFDANGAVFEPLLDEESAIITDSLNHASIIDGVRLCKAKRWIYKHADMRDVEEIDPETGKPLKGLERCLKEAQGSHVIMIATDGVFSMDGDIANLNAICDLAEKYGALVMVDDSHATGFMGVHGRGTWEYCNVAGRVDIITTTFGKALGGASGGVIAARKEIVEYMRQKGRPYLFSNTLAPAIVGGTLKAIEILTESTELRDRLESNTALFRRLMTEAGFDIRPGEHPICPVMLYDEKLAHRMADALLDEGIYVIGFSFPVVPRGKARIRVQISAGHSEAQIRKAVDAFKKIGKRLGVI